MLKSNDYYVYSHNRISNGKCFYIGKGLNNRMLQGDKRNDEWYNIVHEEKGFKYNILISNLTESDAFKYEKKFIDEIGLGSLCNKKIGPKKGYKRKYFNGNPQRVNVDGVTYRSKREAARRLDTSMMGLKRRLDSPNFSNYTYVDL